MFAKTSGKYNRKAPAALCVAVFNKAVPNTGKRVPARREENPAAWRGVYEIIAAISPGARLTAPDIICRHFSLIFYKNARKLAQYSPRFLFNGKSAVASDGGLYALLPYLSRPRKKIARVPGPEWAPITRST